MEKMIKRFVLTGGPCSGKTTALTQLRDTLMSLGYYVLVVPELATRFMEIGISCRTGFLNSNEFQKFLFGEQLHQEKLIRQMCTVTEAEKVVMLYDRGLMDSQAYMLYPHFFKLVRSFGKQIVEVRDEPYDSVFHLVTAADGAEAFYSSETNPFRIESPKQAVRLDKKIQKAWVGHQHLRIFDNSTSFEEKIKRLKNEVLHALGMPPLEIEKSFLVKALSPRHLPKPCAKIDIEQIYLATLRPDTELRIRKRGQFGAFLYFLTRKTDVLPGVRIETESLIREKEYGERKKDRDVRCWPIEKSRYCFPWQGQMFEYDIFHGHRAGTHKLEIELSSKNQEIKLPPQFKVLKDVTGDKEWSNRALAFRR